MLAQHLGLVMVGKDDHIVSDPVGGFPRSAYSVLLRFRRSQSHEEPGNAESALAASNNEVSSDKQSTTCSGAALIKEPPWANHTTAATCDFTSVGCSNASTLAGPRRTIFPTRPRSRPPPTPPLLLRKVLNNYPTVDLAYLAIRKVFRASARTKAVWAAV